MAVTSETGAVPAAQAEAAAPTASPKAGEASLAVMVALSLSHCLNDLIQSLLPAIYPILKQELRLDFGQIGLLTFTFQLTASLLQPLVGILTDRYPQPFSLAFGMCLSLAGLLILSVSHTFGLTLLAAGIIGSGSSIFHPESSRVARMASGGRYGFAQSLFQVGGNSGQAIGPLLAALIVVPFGQPAIAWFSVAAFAGMTILFLVGRWYAAQLAASRRTAAKRAAPPAPPLSRNKVLLSIGILLLLIFSKNFYMSSFTSYYTFYLINHFGVSVQQSQLYLFVFMGSIALGTLFGGPLGDRIGRRAVLWFSILGALPFALALPYASLSVTLVLAGVVGFIMASAFPAIVVYAQELLPGRVGLVAGLFFGFSFGMGGVGAAVLGALADRTSIEFVYQICSVLPAIGLVMFLLPRHAPAEGRAH